MNMTHDKTELIARINAIRREIDELADFALSIEEPKPVQAMPVIQPEPDLWLTPKQVCKRLNIAYTTFYDWVRQGKLPPGREFSAKAKRWRMSEIEAWQEGKQNGTTVNIVVNELPKRRGRPSKIHRKENLYD